MFVIRAQRLFDGFQFRRYANIYVEGSMLTRVDYGQLPVTEGIDVIDLGSATLLPGLVDAHVHLCLDASDDPVGHLSEVDDSQLLLEMGRAARRALAAGVTSLRDLGDRSFLAVRLRESLASAPGLGPTIMPAGPPLTSIGGHCWFLGGEVAESSGALKHAVARHVQRGVGVIKVMATGGELTPGSRSEVSQFSLEQLQTIASEAHSHGLPAVAHAHGRDGIIAAMRAGFDGIEHASFLTADGLEPDDQVIEQLAASGVYVGMNMGFLPEPARRIRAADISALAAELARTMIAAGAKTVLSSDAGIGKAVPHDALPRVIVSAAARGIDTVDVLRAVTSRAADGCGFLRKGRIASGYDADLLAVKGDLLTDITSITRPVHIWHRGTAIPVGDQTSTS